jgi:hypothetical protein
MQNLYIMIVYTIVFNGLLLSDCNIIFILPMPDLPAKIDRISG